MTPGSPHSPYAEVRRLAGMCSGPVEPLLLATDELGDVDEVVDVVAAVGAGTVAAAAGLVIPLVLIGVEAFCEGGCCCCCWRLLLLVDESGITDGGGGGLSS